MNAAIETIRTLLRQYPDAEWGPAHVVLSDYNLEDYFIEVAIAELQVIEHRTAEQEATLTCLQTLLAIPERERTDYE